MTSSPIACLSLANNEVRLFEPTTKDLIICSRNHAGCQGERGAYYLYSNSGVLPRHSRTLQGSCRLRKPPGPFNVGVVPAPPDSAEASIVVYLVAARLCRVTDAPCSVAACRIAPRPGSYPAFPREGAHHHQRRPVKCIALRGREAFEAGGIPVIGCHDFARTVGSSLAKSLSLPFLQTTTFNSPGW
jgi:hypothetical protein